MAVCPCPSCTNKRATRKKISFRYGWIRKVLQETPYDGCTLVLNVPNVPSFKRQINLYGLSFQKLGENDFIVTDRP